MILLSVCISTHNRAGFLKQNLLRLAGMVERKDVEIVVCADACTDNTNEVVESFIEKHPKIKLVYKKPKKRLYFDRVILKMVSVASGKYCWLLGDDDLAERGSVERILKVLQKYPRVSLVHMNYSRFDNVLKKITAKRMVGNIKKDKFFVDADNFFFKQIKDSYFNFLGTNVITMSTDVVNKELWLEAARDMKRYIGHNFIHCFVIGTMIKDNPRIYYLAQPNVQYLANNHRIWPNDIWRDYNEIFLGYLMQIGYSKVKVLAMQEMQRKYEKREAAMKHPLLKYGYPLVKPLLASLRYIKSRFL